MFFNFSSLSLKHFKIVGDSDNPDRQFDAWLEGRATADWFCHSVERTTHSVEARINENRFALCGQLKFSH